MQKMKAIGRGTVIQTTKEELLTPLKTQKYVRNQVTQRPAKIFPENSVGYPGEPIGFILVS
jgi:hypothetical protein